MMASAPTGTSPLRASPADPAVNVQPAHPPEGAVLLPQDSRRWQVKGPLGSYALHFERVEKDFKKEQERLKKDLAAAFALKTRYAWLSRLLDYASDERMPEIDAEWTAIQQVKTALQTSQNVSKRLSIASDASTLLPIWQTPVKTPEILKTRWRRVQRVVEVQKLISEEAAKRLVEFQKIESDQKILDAQLLEIAKLERSICEKVVCLLPSSYNLDGMSSLKRECRIDKTRYPNAEVHFQEIKDKYSAAEQVWCEAKSYLNQTRGKLEEWASILQDNPSFLFSQANGGLAATVGFYLEAVKKQLLLCDRFQTDEFNERVDFLARLGLAHPEAKLWVDQAQEEVERRLKQLQYELQIVQPILAKFEKDVLASLAAKGKVSPLPSAPLAPLPPSPGLMERVTASLSSLIRKSSPSLYASSEPIVWPQTTAVEAKYCLASLVAKLDKLERIRPPAAYRRDFAGIPRESWTIVDHWDHCLQVEWPGACQLLTESGQLLEINGSIAQLDARYRLFKQLFEEMKDNANPDLVKLKTWLETLYWELRDASSLHESQRALLKKKYEDFQTELTSVIAQIATTNQKGRISGGEPLDVAAREMQDKMEEACLEFKMLSALLRTEWEFGERAQKIQVELASNQKVYSPAGKNAASRAHLEPLDKGESPAAPESKDGKSRNFFESILKAKTPKERNEQLAAMETEAYKVERGKLVQHAQKFRAEAEKLNRFLDGLLAIFANWQHLGNMAAALTAAKEESLPESSLKLLILPLMATFNQVKSDVVSYGPLISDVMKRLKDRASLLEEKLTPEKIAWRQNQEQYLMRTPEGNRERDRQLRQEIGKLHFGIKAIEAFWKLGDATCRLALTRINGLLTTSDGGAVTMIDETPYPSQMPPASPVLRPVTSAVEQPKAPAESVPVTKGWIDFTDNETIMSISTDQPPPRMVQELASESLSPPSAALPKVPAPDSPPPAAQPEVPVRESAIAAPEHHEQFLTSSQLENLMRDAASLAEGLSVKAPVAVPAGASQVSGEGASMAIADLTASIHLNSQKPAEPVVNQDE